MIEVVDVHLEYVTDDVTGLLTGGWLLLSCHLHRFQITARPWSANHAAFWSIIMIDGVQVHTTVPPEEHDEFAMLYLDESIDCFNLVARQDLFCIPARLRDEGSRLEILLLQLIDTDNGTYSRLGYMSTSEEKKTKVLQAMFDMPQLETLPCVSFEAGMYTIRVI